MTGRTDHSQGIHSSPPQLPPALDGAAKKGRTASQQTVQVSQEQNQIPEAQETFDSKTLDQRQLLTVEPSDSLISRCAAWVTRQPKPSDIKEIEQLAQKLALSRGGNSESIAHLKFKNGKIKLYYCQQADGIGPYDAEVKSLMFLVKAGLVKIKGTSPFVDAKATFELVRPKNLKAQKLRAALFESMTSKSVAAHTILDWENLLDQIPQPTRKNLKTSGMIVPDPRGYWGSYDDRISRYRSDKHYGSAEEKFLALEAQEGRHYTLGIGNTSHLEEHHENL